MTTKAKVKVKKESAAVISAAATIEIEIDSIIPSRFKPQELRRNKFSDENLADLADSIKKQGLINPLTVRSVKLLDPVRLSDKKIKYELVAGERRWCAARLAGLKSIQVFVRELSDADALEIQLQENLQRKDIDPLEEAFSYKFLMDNFNYSVLDLSLKFSKGEKFITARLKLNELIPEALEDIAAGHLPLGHAAELAKLPISSQKDALDLAFEQEYKSGIGAYRPVKSKPIVFHSFLKKIKNDILLELNSAKFDRKNASLHPEGLVCGKCPQRTGAENSLFEDFHEKKNDRCLNRECFSRKTYLALKQVRDQLSAEAIASGQPEGYKIPLLCQYESHEAEVIALWGEPVLGDKQYRGYGGCKNMETGLYVDDTWRYGATAEICRTKGCKGHSSSSSISSESTSEAQRKANAKRKQEIFDVKVGEEVRKRVFAEAMKKFDGLKGVSVKVQWFERLLRRSWDLQYSKDSKTSEVIAEIINTEKWRIEPVSGYMDDKKFKHFLANLSTDHQIMLLFLLLNAYKGAMYYGNFVPQTEVVELAEEFNVNYKMIDASVRLSKSPKKYMPEAQEYFNAVENNPETAKKPVFYK